MASDPSTSRRVSRLENDTEAIYELLSTHTRRFDRIERTLAEHTRRFDEHTGRFDGLTGRFDGLTGRFDELTGRFDEHTGRFDRIDHTLAEIVRRLPSTS